MQGFLIKALLDLIVNYVEQNIVGFITILAITGSIVVTSLTLTLNNAASNIRNRSRSTGGKRNTSSNKSAANKRQNHRK